MRVDPAPDERKAGSRLPSIVTSLMTDPESVGLAKTWGEAAFDATLQAGVLKDIPTIGLFVKLVGLPWSIRDLLLVKKMGSFIHALSGVAEEKLRQFRDNINADPKLRDRVGENVLLLLERADDMEKPALLGRAFVAFIDGKVTYEQLGRMTAGIDRALMGDIERLREFAQHFTYDQWGAGLNYAGLARAAVTNASGPKYMIYIISDIGTLVLDHCLARSADSEG